MANIFENIEGKEGIMNNGYGASLSHRWKKKQINEKEKNRMNE